MRQALAVFGIGVLALAVASGGHAQQRAASCAGVACGQIAASVETCEAYNKSDQPVRLLIIRGTKPGTSPTQPLEVGLAPGERKSLKAGGTCQIEFGIAHLMATFVSASPPADQSKTVRPGDIFGQVKQKCSGASCQPVSLRTIGDCVWLQSSSSEPIAVSVKVGAETLQVALEGASSGKAAERQKKIEAAKVSGPKPGEAQRCDKLFKSEALLKQMRGRGGNIPYNPEIEGGAESCRAAEARRKAAEQALQEGPTETAYHASIYDARSLGSGEIVVFRAKLLPKSGCVKSEADVESYTANPVK